MPSPPARLTPRCADRRDRCGQGVLPRPRRAHAVGNDRRTRVGVRPRRPMTFALSVPKPLIAAINGACAGIGFIRQRAPTCGSEHAGQS